MCQLIIPTFGTTSPWVTMDQEIKMIGIDTTKLTSIPHTSNQPRPERIHLTVKAAAQRLRKSLSTVYRIDRKNGPFRFVIDGRRVFIDADSLESYLDSIEGIHADDGGQEIECVPSPLHQLTQVISPSPNSVREIKTPTVATPIVPLPPLKAGGQRELVMNQSLGFYIVQYKSFVA
jgi:hypothetical protein